MSSDMFHIAAKAKHFSDFLCRVLPIVSSVSTLNRGGYTYCRGLMRIAEFLSHLRDKKPPVSGWCSIMKNDRLRKNYDDIDNLKDVLKAHSGQTSHIAQDIDSFESDIDIPEDIDVDEALTFPHPKHKKAEEEVVLLGSPDPTGADEDQDDWMHQEFLPSDYSEGFDEMISTSPEDDEDGEMQSRVHNKSLISMEQIAEEKEFEVMPKKFTSKENE